MMVLPVPPPPQDEQPVGPNWELAAPTVPDQPQVPRGNEVTMTRTGPGDVTNISDQWMGEDIYAVTHAGVQNGRQNFVEIPGPPPEGHGGYDFPDSPPWIDVSTRLQALFWSDWYASVAANAGGGGSFRGEHIAIARIPPGSIQGYQPTDPGMVQLNTARNIPAPWDASLVIGGTYA
jgi:hypothetical protein